MDAERWRRIEEIYHRAAELGAGERTAYLEKTCGDDPELRHQVQWLLVEETRTGGFLARPIWSARGRPGWGPLGPRDIPYWSRALIVIAALKVFWAVVAVVLRGGVGVSGAGGFPPWIHLVQALTFGVLGAFLVLAADQDRRAGWLGGTLLLIAAPFADAVLRRISLIDGTFYLGDAVRVDAFLPLFFWMFLRDFPVGYWPRRARMTHWFTVASGWAGAAVFAVNFALLIWSAEPAVFRELIASAGGTAPGRAYWTLLFGLAAPGLLLMVWCARRAGPSERRRVGVFVTGLLIGCGPMLVEVLLESLVPPYARVMRRPEVEAASGIVLYSLLAGVPLLTAYSVLLDGVVQLRVVLREAVQYSLARYTLLAAVVVPFVTLAGYVFAHRNEQVVLGPHALGLALIAGIGAVGLRVRRPMIAALDRRFFRGHMRECDACTALYPPGNEVCPCGRETRPSPVPPVLRDAYRFEARIGKGGMGVVYRARDLALDRVVAAKTVRRMSSEDEARLKQEARTMASLRHPNLATIFAVERWRGSSLLIVEYLGGGTLDDRLSEGPLEIEDVVDFGVAIASALEHLHGKGIVHCDVKPANIAFGAPRHAILLDFGVARIMAETSHLAARGDGAMKGGSASDDFAELTTRTDPYGNRIVGTPPYMSPEALLAGRPGPGFDLWSLAVVLYEALAGEHPFAASSYFEVLKNVVNGDPPRIAQRGDRRADCPDDLADLLARALARDPRRRPGTAQVFRQELERIRVAHASVSTGSEGGVR